MLLATIMMVALSCSKEKNDVSSSSSITKAAGTTQNTCPGAKYDLWGGQTLDWGAVQVWTDQNNLYVQYLVNQDIPNMSITQVHLWVGTTALGFPKNSQGVPVPGQFPFTATFNPAVTEYLFTIPLSNFKPLLTCGSPLYIMAHAVMSDGNTTQTAWGGDGGTIINVPGKGTGRWYFEIGSPTNLFYTCGCTYECSGYQTETAYGGNSIGPIGKPGNQSWWGYYLSATGGVQTLWAGKNVDAGTVEYTAADNGTFTIVLANGWEVNAEAYPTDYVKWQGYITLPTNRPEPGQMANHTTDLKLTNVNDPITGLPYPYYVIHVDVRKCVNLIP